MYVWRGWECEGISVHVWGCVVVNTWTSLHMYMTIHKCTHGCTSVKVWVFMCTYVFECGCVVLCLRWIFLRTTVIPQRLV